MDVQLTPQFSFLSVRNILVLLESAVSGHHYFKIRERLGDKIEMIAFDPYSE